MPYDVPSYDDQGTFFSGINFHTSSFYVPTYTSESTCESLDQVIGVSQFDVSLLSCSPFLCSVERLGEQWQQDKKHHILTLKQRNSQLSKKLERLNATHNDFQAEKWNIYAWRDDGMRGITLFSYIIDI